MRNPFVYLGPVLPSQFIIRDEELRELRDCLLSGSQAVLAGEPRIGKTSLLKFISHKDVSTKMLASSSKRIIFSYIDAYMFNSEATTAKFWEKSLYPIAQVLRSTEQYDVLRSNFRECEEGSYDNFALPSLFEQMDRDDWRLVLMIDEFDVLLYRDPFNTSDFLGNLRHVSHNNPSLVTIISTRRPISDLNRITAPLSMGSPLFNVYSEIILRPFNIKQVGKLLGRANEIFSSRDRYFLYNMAGGQPFLLQLGAYKLFQAYVDGIIDEAERWRLIGEELRREASMSIEDSWRFWTPAQKRAFTIVSLVQIAFKRDGPQMDRHFKLERFVDHLKEVNQEIRWLAKQGFIEPSKELITGWKVSSGAYIWWVADEIERILRPKRGVKDWLDMQEWQGLFTGEEHQRLEKWVEFVGSLVQKGASSLVEAAVNSASETLLGN